MIRVKTAFCVCLAVAVLGVAADAATVTMLTDSGFAFHGEEYSIMIDGLVEYRSTDERQDLMRQAAAPYDADILLITHSHHDHFDVDLVADNMNSNPEAILVGPPDVIERLADRVPDIGEGRLLEVEPSLGEPVTVELPGFTLTAFSFPHPPDGDPLNVGYLFEIDSITILHPGDLDMDDAGALFEANGLGELELDVVFLPMFMLRSASRCEPLDSLSIGCIIASHASPFEQSRGEPIAAGHLENLFCFDDYLDVVELTADSGCPAGE